MRKTTAAFCVALALFLTILATSGFAQTESADETPETKDEQGRFLYLDIPYDTITPEGVEQILMEKFGKIQRNETNGHFRITDFGYPFNFTVNIKPNAIGAGRIILGREGSDWATGDTFRAMFEKDILQFVDMEAQLYKRYGDPNFRFFFTNAGNYHMKGNTRFMFPGNVWDASQMTEVCDRDRYLESYSCWDNITLRLWINWYKEEKRGYSTRLTLEFFDELYPKESPAQIIDYPPDGG